MKTLSSPWTVVWKRGFPLLWFGVLAAVLMTLLLSGAAAEGPIVLMMLVPIGMAVFGYIFMKVMVFDLMDAVYDEGDSLLFVNKGKEVRVALTDIRNISYAKMMNPPRVTVSLRVDTEFGRDLTFTPPRNFLAFGKNTDIEDLIDRIDQAKTGNAGRAYS